MTTELYIELRQYLRELIRNTEWEGHLYAVGECCRDELMGQPIKDVSESMCRNAHRLEIITTERIRTELDKMLTCKRPVMALELLRDTRALQFVIPELAETFDMRQNRYHFGTVWQHTLKVVEGVPNQLVLRLAALLHDVGKINTRSVGEDGSVHFIGHEIASVDLAVDILRRLKYSNAVIHEVAFLIRHHMDLKNYGDDAKKLKDKKLRKIQYICGTKDRFENMLALIDADNKAHADGYCMTNQVEIVSRRTAAMEDDGSAMFGYRMPLSGNDIMRIKGLKPGPEVKDCTEYLMKLAFVNPLRPVEELSIEKKTDRPICFISYNLDAYSQHCRTYAEYQRWVKERNPERYRSNLDKSYDSKNMMHMFRLVHMASEIAEGRGVILERTYDRQFLLNVRNHKYEYDELMAMLEEDASQMNALMTASTIPDRIDPDFVNSLMIEIRTRQFQL